MARLTRTKRIVFNGLMFLCVYGIIECCALVVLCIFGGSLSEIAQQRHRIATQNPFQPLQSQASALLLHPYIGATQQPREDGSDRTGNFRITEYGFIDDDLPIHRRTPDTVIVAILGGSVAHQFSMQATDTLAAELTKSPAFAGRQFKFVRLASNGYKQPQQLMTIMYLMSLGAEFDVVINLDGFNEVALPSIDNIPFGVYFAYPRDWGSLLAFFRDPEFLKRAGYLSYLRESQRDMAAWADQKPWVYSPLTQFIWNSWNRRTELRIVAATRDMAQHAQKELSYCSAGPPKKYASKTEMYRDCIDLWHRSSILLHRICQASGTKYFHGLQPNQHLLGSKPIEGDELRMLGNQGNPNSEPVKDCYPIMKAEQSVLTAQGVAFFDLTEVFADHPEPIYVDSCCHVNDKGNQILAHAIGQRIRDYLANHP